MEQTFHWMMAQACLFQMGTQWWQQTFIEGTKQYLPGLNINTLSRTGWLKGREDILRMACTLTFGCIWHLCSLTSWEKIRSRTFWYSSSLSSKDLLLICSFSRGILSYKIHQNTTIRVYNLWHTKLTVGHWMLLSVGGQTLVIFWHISTSPINQFSVSETSRRKNFLVVCLAKHIRRKETKSNEQR